MKTTKRLLSCLLVLAMLFALAIPAFAADGPEYKITITNPNVGSTYTVYKVFSAQYDAEADAISYQGTIAKDLETYFTKDSAGNIILKTDTRTVEGEEETYYPATGTTSAKDELIPTVRELLKTNYAIDTNRATTPIGPVEAGTESITFNLTEAGYYIVTCDGEGRSIVSVNSTAPTANVIDKNASQPSKPEGHERYKSIVLDDVTLVKEISKDIGSTVNFDVSFVAINNVVVDDPDHEGQKITVPVKTYTVKDTAEGMTVDLAMATVKVGEATLTKDTDWSIENDDTIVIKWNGQSYAKNNSVVTITYSGVTTAEEATNDAKIGYTYGTDGTGETPDPDPDPTKVVSSAVIVHKVDENNKPLPGAKFVLQNSENKYYSLTEDGKVEWVDTQEKATEIEAVEDDDNMMTATFTGLKAGKYKLVETVAPKGYNGLTAPVETEIKTNDEETDLTLLAAQETVVNEKGTVLPSTGGIGTTMFYVVGGLLVAAAVVVLVSKKRMGAEQ